MKIGVWSSEDDGIAGLIENLFGESSICLAIRTSSNSAALKPIRFGRAIERKETTAPQNNRATAATRINYGAKADGNVVATSDDDAGICELFSDK